MIYDCFTFFNELDLLEIRLNVLSDVVDKFVIVEATRTFQGKEKPLFFQNNKDRFKSFENKIIHIVVDHYPYLVARLRKAHAWDMEKFQRNQIQKGLKNCVANDTIIISDLDEIINPSRLKQVIGKNSISIFELRNYAYFINCESKAEEKWWAGPVVISYKNFVRPQRLRKVSNKMNSNNMAVVKNRFRRIAKSIVEPLYRHEINLIKDSGWHFSYLGGAEKIIEKLEAYSHTEYNTPQYKNRDSIIRLIETGMDIFGRGMKYEFVELGDSFPQYLRDHRARYRSLFHEVDSNQSKT
jgi:beta-1,4-mannosyl-glycoprotein beta-1,4-N-acetylglucosaminyltransferase